MRFLRFLWLIVRGVLIAAAFLAALFGTIAGAFRLVGPDAVMIIVIGGSLLAMLIGLGFWLRWCWVDSGKAKT